MNRPSLSVRIAGYPLGGIALVLLGGWMMLSWYQGQASFFFALIGFFVIAKTLASLMKMKRYQAWLKEWNSVGTFGQEPAKPRRRSLRGITLLAAALFVGILAYWPQTADRPQLQNELAWVWFSCGVFLLGRLLISIGRLVRKRNAAKAARLGDEAVPVAWMLTGTVDSPSREMAVRNLPEYAARVLNNQPARAAM
jgi:hypothetical protein